MGRAYAKRGTDKPKGGSTDEPNNQRVGERQMSTPMSKRKELAWQALTLAEDRFSDAAAVIADKLAFMCEQPTEAELEAYRDATRTLARAHREYAKTIQNEADK